MSGVSFLVTVFNKRAYLPQVVRSLAAQTGLFEREFIFVDDGSDDGSADLLTELTRDWMVPVEIIRQPNLGASAATNRGVERATMPWLKLLDGDDLLLPDATEALLDAAVGNEESLAYGDLATYRPAQEPPALPRCSSLDVELVPDGLARFIRNCPANSSAMLIGRDRYRRAGGCDERLVSPDQALFLRLFAAGGGVHLAGAVALVPEQAPGRLSGQTRRSRYESALALYHLVTETPGISEHHALLAYRRTMSRAVRFHRAHGGGVMSPHLTRYLASFLRRRADPAAMYQALGAFTETGSPSRPDTWLPGILRSELPHPGRN
jgi:glycosyltransferase involved in cell wall biosynthesis